MFSIFAVYVCVCECAWRFFLSQYFFLALLSDFFCMSHIEIWIIVTLYWAWHWSRRNRCALQQSRRVYHHRRALFFYIYYHIFKFLKRMRRKVNIHPKKGKTYQTNKKERKEDTWNSRGSKWYDVFIYHLLTSSPTYSRYPFVCNAQFVYHQRLFFYPLSGVAVKTITCNAIFYIYAFKQPTEYEYDLERIDTMKPIHVCNVYLLEFGWILYSL